MTTQFLAKKDPEYKRVEQYRCSDIDFLQQLCHDAGLSLFLSTPSARRATFLYERRRASCSAFLSTPSARRATTSSKTTFWRARNFYPRPPRGGRPAARILSPLRINDFYPRPPRGGRPLAPFFDAVDGTISIHALREEGDPPRALPPLPWRNFYPRPPRGGRQLDSSKSICIKVFLSTPSARRATHRTTRFDHRSEFLSTPSARRATSPAPSTRPRRDISIHALREEGDAALSVILALAELFLSTPSARRATAAR